MKTKMNKYQLFVDLDGVLVDFAEGVRKATGKEPEKLHPSRMWPILAKTRNFYGNLNWTKDGRQLWDKIHAYNPVISTGLPIGKWGEPQKRSWCKRELGSGIFVITCLSRHKARHAADWMQENSQPDIIPILIDDRIGISKAWKDIGGHFILHLSAQHSIKALESIIG